MAFFCAA
jgi:hypothetical protein